MERELIAWLRRHLPSHPCLRLGAGDDAAILHLAQKADAVVTADLLAEGAHFLLGEATPRQVGYKALAVNLSDLAAMASKPVAVVVALLLPRSGALQLAVDVITGMLPLAARFEVAIAGGDTNTWDGPLVVSVTAIGETTPHGPWCRRGARPGDRLLVTGTLGGSRLGHHLNFEPRVGEALLLSEKYEIHAAIDLSDGLATDLRHVVEQSGCGAEVLLPAIPISAAARRLAAMEDDAQADVRHALCDGEDFELLLAVAPREAERLLVDQPLDVPLCDVGRFVDEAGLWQVDADGQRRELSETGFEHRADP